jgi:hypothetical protein
MLKGGIIAAAIGCVVLFSRAPFLDAGYGWDNDAWGNMQAAQRLHTTGEATFARPPGYPVFVGVASLLWPAGPVAVNAFTAVCSAIAAVFFFLLMGRAGIDTSRSALAALALAAVPVIYVNSTVAMDYLWALAAILGAWWAFLAGRPIWAGILLGVATGCRITSAGMWLPLALMGWLERRPVRDMLAMTLSAAAVAAAAFAPVVLKNGFGYLTFSDQPFSEFRPFLLHALTDFLWGVVGTIGLAAALLYRLVAAPVTNPLSPSLRAASLTAVAMYVVLFFRLPAESAYLIPIVPFVLLLLAGTLRRRIFIGFCVALVVSPFLLHSPRVPHHLATPSGAHALRYTRRLAPCGPVFQLDRARRGQMEGIRFLAETVARLGADRTLVVCDAFHDYVTALPRPRFRAVKAIAAEELKRRLAGGEAVVFARGYNNKLLLVYEARLSAAGGIETVVHHLLSDRHGATLEELAPSATDRAMIAGTVGSGNGWSYVEAFLQQPGFVPIGPSDLAMLCRGVPCRVFCDDAARGAAFLACNPGMQLRPTSGGEAILAVPDGMGLLANPGFVTERFFPPDEVGRFSPPR